MSVTKKQALSAIGETTGLAAGRPTDAPWQRRRPSLRHSRSLAEPCSRAAEGRRDANLREALIYTPDTMNDAAVTANLVNPAVTCTAGMPARRPRQLPAVQRTNTRLRSANDALYACMAARALRRWSPECYRSLGCAIE